MSSAAPANPSPHPKPWEEKNPWIAGTLAFLVPGAGHLYQGRTTKGLIYFFSILGLFIWGQKMGEGMVVYNRPESGGVLRYVSLSYAAQLGVGAAALPALLQNRRADQDSNRANDIGASLTARFQGTLNPTDDPDAGRLVGTIHLEPVESQFDTEVRGTFDGTLDGQPAKLDLGGRFELDRAIKAGFGRRLECGVLDKNTTHRWIAGTIPRSFVNAYASPPDPDQLQEINGRLGKLYELALVFTWIAGLLNVLAIWDCVLGPAYGFGDELALARKAETQSTPTPASATAPAPVSAAPVPEGAPPTNGSGEPPRAENRPPQKSPV